MSTVGDGGAALAHSAAAQIHSVRVGGASATLSAARWLDRVTPTVPDSVVRELAQQTWKRDIDFKGPAVYPSPSYGGVYLRDTFWTTGALPDAAFSLRMRQQFGAQQRANGQVPSLFRRAHGPAQYNDDESTILYVLWMCRDNTRSGTPPDMPSLNSALRYLRRFDHQGYYVSDTGNSRSWLDSFKVPIVDTLSYNQGLYAAALQCAQTLRAAVTPEQVADARQAYGALYRPYLHFIPLGRRQTATDASALVGEFVSLWLFNRPLLSDTAVLSTLAHLSVTPVGYKVVASFSGEYLSPDRFFVTRPSGDYQNGATWLLYDYMALATGYLHGWIQARTLMNRRLALDLADGYLFSEYRCTNPSLACYTNADPNRQYTAWNTFVLVVNEVVARSRRR